MFQLIQCGFQQERHDTKSVGREAGTLKQAIDFILIHLQVRPLLEQVLSLQMGIVGQTHQFLIADRLLRVLGIGGHVSHVTASLMVLALRLAR